MNSFILKKVESIPRRKGCGEGKNQIILMNIYHAMNDGEIAHLNRAKIKHMISFLSLTLRGLKKIGKISKNTKIVFRGDDIFLIKAK